MGGLCRAGDVSAAVFDRLKPWPGGGELKPDADAGVVVWVRAARLGASSNVEAIVHLQRSREAGGGLHEEHTSLVKTLRGISSKATWLGAPEARARVTATVWQGGGYGMAIGARLAAAGSVPRDAREDRVPVAPGRGLPRVGPGGTVALGCVC